MSRQKLSASCRVVLRALLASLLAVGWAWAQARPRPLDAALGVFFAADAATVESFLLESTKAQLQQLEPAEREDFLSALRIRRNLEERERFRVERVNQGNTLLRLYPPGSPQPLTVVLDKEQATGDRAVVEALVQGGAEAGRVTVRLSWENGSWRLAGFQVQAPTGRSFGMQLDDPSFLESLMESRRSASEVAAVASMRNYLSGCIFYSANHPDLGFPATLSLLGPAGDNSVDAELTPAGGGNTVARSGYRFTYTPGKVDTYGRVNTFTVSARPVKYGATGRRSFFVDESGWIRFTTEDRAATAADPPLQ